jgi:hypothetical protein
MIDDVRQLTERKSYRSEGAMCRATVCRKVLDRISGPILYKAGCANE